MVSSQPRALPRSRPLPGALPDPVGDVLCDIVGCGGIPDDAGQVTDHLGLETLEELSEGISILFGDGGEEVFVCHSCPLVTKRQGTTEYTDRRQRGDVAGPEYVGVRGSG